MPLVTTEVFDKLLIADALGSGYAPLPFSPVFTGRADMAAYQDNAQAVPAVAWGDQLQQWHDEREAPGGSTYPYFNQPTGGTRPTMAPQLTAALGGIRSVRQEMAGVGFPAVNKQNFTAVITGILATDYSAPAGAVMLALGDAVGGLSTWTAAPSVNNLVTVDNVYSSADHVEPTVDVHFSPYQTYVIQSTPSGVTPYLNGVAGTTQPAAASATFTAYRLFDWSIGGSSPFNSFISRVALYSPALSAPDLASLISLLNAEASLRSMYPLSYPLIAFWGNSLTVGIGHGGITQSQTYPAQVMAALTHPFGYLLGAVSSKTTLQLAPIAPGMDGHLTVARSGAEVFIGWELANDIADGGGAPTTYANYKAFFQARRAAGWPFIVALDCMANSGITGPAEVVRTTVNADLAADFTGGTASPHILLAGVGTTYADLLIQVSAIPELMDPTNATYFSDGTHLTAAGYGILAGYVLTCLAHFGVT